MQTPADFFFAGPQSRFNLDLADFDATKFNFLEYFCFRHLFKYEWHCRDIFITKQQKFMAIFLSPVSEASREVANLT